MHSYQSLSRILALALSVFVPAAAAAGDPPGPGDSPPQPPPGTGETDAVSIPVDNHAYWFGYGGSLDTDIDIDDFAHDDFTISVWVQPQYEFGGRGPILAENGSGRLTIGQGDYYNGRYVLGQTAADPMLRIGFANRTALFEVPEFAGDNWTHLTVVRSNDRISVFVNGGARPVFQRSPSDPSTLDIDTTSTRQPHGTLRVGRRTDGAPDTDAGQFYGFVDDVGIFREALSPAAIATLAVTNRLQGDEAGLWRGIGMDQARESTDLPPSLRTQLTAHSATRQYAVSGLRLQGDANIWDNPFHLYSVFPEPIQLPFAIGEEWLVTQGMNNSISSHNGGTAFASMDFERTGGGACTDGQVYTTAPGYVRSYIQSDDPPAGTNEANFLHYRVSSDLGFTYMHFGFQGMVSEISGGVPHPDYPTWSTYLRTRGVQMDQGENLGHLGDGGCHLHIGAWESDLGDRIPYPFADFEASVDLGNTWFPVLRGIPRVGMLVRRMKDAG